VVTEQNMPGSTGGGIGLPEGYRHGGGVYDSDARANRRVSGKSPQDPHKVATITHESAVVEDGASAPPAVQAEMRSGRD
jgi:hypothetical protein